MLGGACSRCTTRQRQNPHTILSSKNLLSVASLFSRSVILYEGLFKARQPVCRCRLEEVGYQRSLEIPTWMFEPTACGQLCLATVPIVGCDAWSNSRLYCERRSGRTVTACYKHSIVPALLASRIRDSLTKSSDLGEDLVSRFCPDEWFRLPVADGQILPNGGFERQRAAMRAALDLLLGQCGKPALDEIQLEGDGRREMQVKPGMACELSPHPRRLVRAVVVENQVNVEVRRDLRVDRIEKLQELLTAMPPVQLADNPARRDIERGEQRGRVVPHVIMRAPFRLARAQRQNRRGAVQGLDLAFFIDRQGQRAIRRVHQQRLLATSQ